MIPCPISPEWDDRKKLAFEKETVGFYITGHPLDDALQEIKTIIDCTIQDLAEMSDDQPVRIGGLIRTCKKHKSKRGDPMAFLTVEDIYESVEVVVFPDAYASCEDILSSTDPVIIQGTVKKDERGPKIIADSIDLLPVAREKYTESATIQSGGRQTFPAADGNNQESPVSVPWLLPGTHHPALSRPRRGGYRSLEGSHHQALPAAHRHGRRDPQIQSGHLQQETDCAGSEEKTLGEPKSKPIDLRRQ